MPEDTDYLSHLLNDILGNWKICAECYSLLYSKFQQHGITQERTIFEDHFCELSQQQKAVKHRVLQAKIALSKHTSIHVSFHSNISSHHSRKSKIDQQLTAMDATLAYEYEQAQIQEEIRHARMKKNGESLKGIRRFNAKKERMQGVSSNWSEKKSELGFQL